MASGELSRDGHSFATRHYQDAWAALIEPTRQPFYNNKKGGTITATLLFSYRQCQRLKNQNLKLTQWLLSCKE